MRFRAVNRSSISRGPLARLVFNGGCGGTGRDLLSYASFLPRSEQKNLSIAKMAVAKSRDSNMSDLHSTVSAGSASDLLNTKMCCIRRISIPCACRIWGLAQRATTALFLRFKFCLSRMLAPPCTHRPVEVYQKILSDRGSIGGMAFLGVGPWGLESASNSPYFPRSFF